MMLLTRDDKEEFLIIEIKIKSGQKLWCNLTFEHFAFNIPQLQRNETKKKKKRKKINVQPKDLKGLK